MTTSINNTSVVFNDATTQSTAPVNTSANVTSVNGSTGAVTVNTVGYNQTWQNVTASRARGTTYTNSTGRTIMVSISWVGSGATTFQVNGVVVGEAGGSYAERNASKFFVPPGNTYLFVSQTPTVVYWFELR